MMKFVNLKNYPLPPELIETPYNFFSVKKIGTIVFIIPGEVDEDSEIVIYKK